MCQPKKFWNLSMLQNHLMALIKIQSAGSSPRIADSLGLEWSLNICIRTGFLVGLMLLAWETHRYKYCLCSNDLSLGWGSSQTGGGFEAENCREIYSYWEVCCEEVSTLLPLIACPCEARLACSGTCLYFSYCLRSRNKLSIHSSREHA